MKKPFQGVTPEQVMCALIGQVARAAQGGTEQDVTTLITRPLWRTWNLAVGNHIDAPPTDWIGIEGTNRVYGSKTIIVESEELWSISKKHTA